MFRTVPLSIISSFFTLHTATVYVIQVLLTACEKDQDGIKICHCRRVPREQN